MKRIFLLVLFSFSLIGCDLSDESDYDDGSDAAPPAPAVVESEGAVEAATSPPATTATESDDTEDEETAATAPEPDSDSPLARDFALPVPLFAPDSAWNQTAVNATVLPQSDEQILVTFRVLLGDISDLEGYDEPATTWPYMDVNVNDYTIPISRAGDAMQEVVICEDEGVLGWALPQFGIESEGGPVTVPAPAGIVRPAGPEDSDADGHLVLYDPATSTEYDYFAAVVEGQQDCRQFEGGMMGQQITEAGVVAFFDVGGAGVSPDSLYSARAHGTPLLAGLILPEDIESGVIAHALALAIPGPRNLSRDPYEPLASDYFYPASTTETDFYNTNPMALAAGQRIRLKQSLVNDDGEPLDESQLAPITQMFLATLRNYGAYLVDNAGGFSFYAEDVHTAVLHLLDDEINALIGQPPDSPLPPDMTKWEIVLETLVNDLEQIPFAISSGDDEPDPETAQVEAANFEVVEPATIP